MSGLRPSHLSRRGAVYGVRFRVPADMRQALGLAEFTRSLHTKEPATARTRCLAATTWFREAILALRRQPSPTREALEQAAAHFFCELSAQIDQPRRFDPDHFDEQLAWNIECSRNRRRELDEQLITNVFERLEVG